MFKKPYPFTSKTKDHLLIALGFVLWVFLFLFIIQPLTVDELPLHQQLIFLPIYGAICGLSYCSFIFIQGYYYKKQKQQWYLHNEIFISVFISLLALTLTWLFFKYVVAVSNPTPVIFNFQKYFIEIFLPAFLVIFPLIVLSRYFLGKQVLKRKQKITINGSGNYEHLQFFIDDLLYIQSSDNYVEVFYLNKNEMKTSVIRNKLSKIEEQHTDLLRIHRSFLINPLHYQQLKIEKGKHFIALNKSILLPVSKTYLENVKLHFAFTSK